MLILRVSYINTKKTMFGLLDWIMFGNNLSFFFSKMQLINIGCDIVYPTITTKKDEFSNQSNWLLNIKNWLLLCLATKLATKCTSCYMSGSHLNLATNDSKFGCHLTTNSKLVANYSNQFYIWILIIANVFIFSCHIT